MNRRWRWFALIAVFALIAAACGDGDTEATTTVPGETTTTEPGATTTEPIGVSGSVSTYIGEPRSLTFTDASESEGLAVLSAVYTQLVDVDLDGNIEFRAAESVETTDGGTTWVVTLRDGFTFHDETPVTAQSYVDAWNYAAFGTNAQGNAAFFSSMVGYDELQCGTITEPDPETGEDTTVADCENQPPTAETMSGLVVDSETQFTVTLGTAESFFPIRLSYVAYNPYPDSFYDDPEAFGEMPIGNGPFQLSEPWSHNVSINLEAFEGYGGDNPAQIETLEFQIYDDVNTALNELLAGNLDIHDAVTAERFEEVAAAVSTGTAESSSINFLGVPWYDSDIGGADNRDLRAALSMAIDREAITEAIFDGRRQPAYNLLSPVIPGYQDLVCDAWSFDPDAAKELYDTTDGLPAQFSFWFNAGADHDAWIEAVTNMWAQNLGIDVTGIQFETLEFADYLQRLQERGVSGPFRLGWGMDYPHPQNYLQLILDSRFSADAGGANYGYYENPDFDAKVDEALAIFDLNDSIPVWQEVAEIACEDVALFPMFYGQYDYAWNDSVDNVSVDANGNPVWTDLVATG